MIYVEILLPELRAGTNSKRSINNHQKHILHLLSVWTDCSKYQSGQHRHYVLHRNRPPWLNNRTTQN
jgi:hypothetical protein